LKTVIIFVILFVTNRGTPPLTIMKGGLAHSTNSFSWRFITDTLAFRDGLLHKSPGRNRRPVAATKDRSTAKIEAVPAYCALTLITLIHLPLWELQPQSHRDRRTREMCWKAHNREEKPH